MDTKFKNNWILWYHNEKDNWSLSGFKQLYKISSIQELWKFYNNWHLMGGITNKHIFLMREDVTPLWEDPTNINGGCWSFKVQESHAEELWEDLTLHLVANSLYACEEKDDILGLSLCIKKNNNVVIKVWNKSSKFNSLKLLNKNVLEKWGTDIIYIAHMPTN